MTKIPIIKNIKGKRIAIAMSGGIDSSVAAYILKKNGAEVVGLTFIHIKEFDSDKVNKIIDILNIEHHFIDIKKEFNKLIIEPFISEYCNAKTPNPCALCNERIKFGIILEKAYKLNCSKFATGHYCSLLKENNNIYLSVASDNTKNQEYFMGRITADILKNIIFPLNNITKTEIKEIGKDIKFDKIVRGESQDICFIPKNNYRDLITIKKPEYVNKTGLILNTKGAILGEHKGLEHYTIGQRRGIGVQYVNPLYVIELDRSKNTIIVGEKNECYSKSMILKDVIWTNSEPDKFPFKTLAKIRYRHSPESAVLTKHSKKTLKLEFDEPVFAVTPGQLAVFYDMSGNYILGSGWINFSYQN